MKKMLPIFIFSILSLQAISYEDPHGADLSRLSQMQHFIEYEIWECKNEILELRERNGIGPYDPVKGISDDEFGKYIIMKYREANLFNILQYLKASEGCLDENEENVSYMER